MDICSSGHEEICYNVRNCPLCHMKEEKEQVEAELEERKKEVDYLKEEVAEHVELIDSLKEQVEELKEGQTILTQVIRR